MPALMFVPQPGVALYGEVGAIMAKHSAGEGFMSRPIPLLRVDKPLMVFGGPYSNLEATRAVLDEAARLSISADRIICTGDVVAYGADAAATVDLVRDRVGHVVMGNCEQSLAAGSDDCGCGFPTGSSCERLSAAWFAYASRELNNDARSWMADLPRRINIEIGGCRLAVIHGGVDMINRFIFASTATGSRPPRALSARRSPLLRPGARTRSTERLPN